jgi:hypothetical protein
MLSVMALLLGFLSGPPDVSVCPATDVESCGARPSVTYDRNGDPRTGLYVAVSQPALVNGVPAVRQPDGGYGRFLPLRPGDHIVVVRTATDELEVTGQAM